MMRILILLVGLVHALGEVNKKCKVQICNSSKRSKNTFIKTIINPKEPHNYSNKYGKPGTGTV